MPKNRIRDTKLNVTKKSEKILASLETCADISDMSTWWWRRKALKGEIESVKMGSRLMIPMSEVNRIIAENTRPRVA